MILKCSCHNEFQDQKYGPGNRVHNPKPKVKDRPQTFRCTVCGTVRDEKGEIVISKK